VLNGGLPPLSAADPAATLDKNPEYRPACHGPPGMEIRKAITMQV
jgi:hypothetical protein